jgi:hypothetical protein
LNAYIRNMALADTSGRVSFIDDTVDMSDGTGAGLAQYFGPGDTYHPNAAGAVQLGVTLASKLTAYYANQSFTSPLITDPANVYPTTNQWGNNPTNAGAVALGSGGSWTGALPTAWTLDVYGGGASAGVVSIVATDDATPVPWIRVKPSSSSAGTNIVLNQAASGRAITTTDPLTYGFVLEVRVNGLMNFDRLELSLNNILFGTKLSNLAYLQLDKAGRSVRGILRKRFKTVGVANSAAVQLAMQITCAASGTGEMGSIDFRCLTCVA